WTTGACGAEACGATFGGPDAGSRGGATFGGPDAGSRGGATFGGPDAGSRGGAASGEGGAASTAVASRGAAATSFIGRAFCHTPPDPASDPGADTGLIPA